MYRRLIAAGASPQEALYLASRPSLCQKISSGQVDAIEGLALQRIAMRAKMPAEIAVKGSAAQQHYRELLALGYTEQKALDEIKTQGQVAPATTATPPPPKVKVAPRTQGAVEPPQVIATAKVEANETLDPTSDNPTFKATEGPQQATITTISHKDFQAILKKIDNKLVQGSIDDLSIDALIQAAESSLDPKIAANLDPKDRSILSIQLAQAWAHKAELQARVDALKQSDTQLDSQDLKPIWGDLDLDTKHQIFMNLKNQENAELQKILQEKQANPGIGFFSKILSGLEQMLILNQIVTNNEIAADQSTTLAAQTIGHKVDEGHKKVNQGLEKVNKVVKFPFTTAEKVAYKKLKEIEAKPKEQWTAEDLQSLDDIVGTINFSNTAQFAINAFLPESIEDAILNIATAKALGVAYKGGKVAFKASKKAIGKSTALAKKLVQNIDFNKLSKAYKARIGKLQGLANELSHKAEQVAAQIIDQMTPQGQQLATLGGNGNLVANLEGRPIKILHVEARSAKDGLNGKAANLNIQKQVEIGKYGRYEDAPYHGKVDNAIKSRAPTNGQSALNNSVQIKETSPHRINYDSEAREIVYLSKTREGLWHGHVRSWEQLTPKEKSVLIKNFGFNDKGKIIK